jgi:hypothetical protein
LLERPFALFRFSGAFEKRRETMRFHRHPAIAAIGAMAIWATPVVSVAHEITPVAAATAQTDDTAKSGSSAEPLSDKLDRSGGVIKPPGGVDPALAKTPPPAGPQSMPVIPPVGGPGGPPGVTAK